MSYFEMRLNQVVFDDVYARELQQIFYSGIPPEGAFLMGLCEAAVIQGFGMHPSWPTLRRLAQCRTFAEGLPIIESYLAALRRGERLEYRRNHRSVEHAALREDLPAGAVDMPRGR